LLVKGLFFSLIVDSRYNHNIVNLIMIQYVICKYNCTIQLEVVEGALLAADAAGIAGRTLDVSGRRRVLECGRGTPQPRRQQALESSASYKMSKKCEDTCSIIIKLHE
jgi:hypothetical protein